MPFPGTSSTGGTGMAGPGRRGSVATPRPESGPGAARTGGRASGPAPAGTGRVTGPDGIGGHARGTRQGRRQQLHQHEHPEAVHDLGTSGPPGGDRDDRQDRGREGVAENNLKHGLHAASLPGFRVSRDDPAIPTRPPACGRHLAVARAEALVADQVGQQGRERAAAELHGQAFQAAGDQRGSLDRSTDQSEVPLRSRVTKPLPSSRSTSFWTVGGAEGPAEDKAGPRAGGSSPRPSPRAPGGRRARSR